MADGLSLDDLSTPPEPQPAPADPLVVPDGAVPEDNGVVEVTGQKIDVGPLLAAERKRVREATEAKIRAEYEPLRQQASEIATLRAEVQRLTPPAPVTPPAPEVSDSDAETYARRHQLYDAESKLDVKTAKSILAETRADLQRVSREAAQEALKPLQANDEQRAAHDNFMRIAATKDRTGAFVFADPATHGALLDAWNALPDHLRAVPEVGDVVVKTALGELALAGHRVRSPVLPAIEREPVLAEAAGARSSTPYTMSVLERKLADEANMSHKDFEARAKTYVKGQPNSLE